MRRGLTVCAALLAAALIAVIAGRDGAPDRGMAARSPDAAVTAYIAAYNARDGAAICRLLAPEVAAAVPRLFVVPGRRRGCARTLTESIQRPSDRQTSGGDGYTFWSKATVLTRGAARRDGPTASIDLRVRHERVADILTSESGCREPLSRSGPPQCRSPEDVADRISLERRDGRWLVTRMGAILYVRRANSSRRQRSTHPARRPRPGVRRVWRRRRRHVPRPPAA